MKKIFAVLFAAFLIAFGNTAFADVPVGQAMPEVSYISIDGSQIQTADLLKDKDAVLKYLRQKFTAIRTALRVKKIDAFPLNESGKILYGALQKMI